MKKTIKYIYVLLVSGQAKIKDGILVCPFFDGWQKVIDVNLMAINPHMHIIRYKGNKYRVWRQSQ